MDTVCTALLIAVYSDVYSMCRLNEAICDSCVSRNRHSDSVGDGARRPGMSSASANLLSSSTDQVCPRELRNRSNGDHFSVITLSLSFLIPLCCTIFCASSVALTRSFYLLSPARFTLCMRRGGLVKVYDNCLMSGVSIFTSRRYPRR